MKTPRAFLSCTNSYLKERTSYRVKYFTNIYFFDKLQIEEGEGGGGYIENERDFEFVV